MPGYVQVRQEAAATQSIHFDVTTAACLQLPGSLLVAVMLEFGGETSCQRLPVVQLFCFVDGLRRVQALQLFGKFHQ